MVSFLFFCVLCCLFLACCKVSSLSVGKHSQACSKVFKGFGAACFAAVALSSPFAALADVTLPSESSGNMEFPRFLEKMAKGEVKDVLFKGTMLKYGNLLP